MNSMETEPAICQSLERSGAIVPANEFFESGTSGQAFQGRPSKPVRTAGDLDTQLDLRLWVCSQGNRATIAAYLRHLVDSIPFEVACGLLLLWYPTRRVGFVLFAISAVDAMSLSSALLRGLTPECGCLGICAPSRVGLWLELVLDAMLACASVLICLHSGMGSIPTAP